MRLADMRKMERKALLIMSILLMMGSASCVKKPGCGKHGSIGGDHGREGCERL